MGHVEMKLEERVASAIQAQTDQLPPTIHDLAVIRASAKAQSRRRVGIAVICAVAVVAAVASGVAGLGERRSDGIGPVAPSPSPTLTGTPSPAEAVDPIEKKGWVSYTSERYDFQIGHPAGWTEDPANRDWQSDDDSANPLSPAHEAFESRSGDVRVSAWQVPLDPATRIESIAFLEAWVEDYCESSGNTPCTGIGDRAVELCLERRDCHPGLLVPFEDDVQAFFSGGIYATGAMTVVTVWRAESAAAVARYGGAQRLLEAFLSTMEVWPASTPTQAAALICPATAPRRLARSQAQSCAARSLASSSFPLPKESGRPAPDSISSFSEPMTYSPHATRQTP